MQKAGSRLVLLAMAVAMLGCGESASSPPQPGVYHLEPFRSGFGHAINIEIGQEGTFQWAGSWCDVSWSGDAGKWRAEGDRLVLTPSGDNDDFAWVFPRFSGVGDDRFERLEVVSGPRSGELIVSGTGELGETVQSWLTGGMCSPGCNTLPEPCECTSPVGPLGCCWGTTPESCDGN